MASWEKLCLKDLCLEGGIQTGPFGSQLHKSDYTDTGVPVIMPVDLVAGDISSQGISRVSEDLAEQLRRHRLRAGDIVYARRGELGRCAYVSQEQEGWLCGTGCLRIRPDKNKIKPLYLFYVLQDPAVIAWVQCHAIGATMPNLNTAILSSMPVQFPKDMKLQETICEILSSYDELIENSKKQIGLLEEAIQRLYKEWFVDFKFPGYENVQINGGLPERWKRVSLGALLGKLETGSRPKGGAFSDRGFNSCVSIGAENVIGLGQYDFDNEKFVTDEYAEKMARGHVADRDILIYKDGAYSGRTSLFQDGFPHETCVVNEHVFLLHSADPNLQYYLFFTLQQKNFYQTMQAISKSKSAQPGLDFDDLRKLKVLLPPKRLIKMFDSTVAPNIKQLFIEARRIRLLYETRDRLLPKLFSREIEV